MKNHPLEICGVKVQPGERLTLALPIPEVYTCAPLHIPMHVIHGKKEGPRLLICATLYGDEANGIDIIHRLLESPVLKALAGTLICIPVMNVYGLINHTRLLPDGHDLAESFPGSEKGSFASRLAHLFTSEIIDLMTHCVNIRSGPKHIYKFPQIYFHPDDHTASHLAKHFGAPIIRPSNEKTGFFYSEQGKPKCPTIIYEGGEAHRSDDYSIKIGVKGVIRTLKELQMIKLKKKPKENRFIEAKKTLWLHAPGSGILQIKKTVGTNINKGDALAVVTDPFGSSRAYELFAPVKGMITSMTTYPHVFEGQQLIEITSSTNPHEVLIEFPSLDPQIEDNL
ncbi:MAG: succinylglutamate desuccinylase/aspartoacylase family protein [Simkaniaceae bacterium]|jgi:predicted deacylase|nr:MAG: succinylglutamate desuccinylase/aspartoacylase family protein [Simkaniaceae bacterium]